MEINEGIVPVTKECVELDDDGILCDTERDEVHSLNSTAASARICCDGRYSIKEIADVVEKCF